MEPVQFSLIAVISTLLLAWLSGVKTAMLTARKQRFEIQNTSVSPLSKLKNAVKENPAKHLASLLTANIVILVVFVYSFYRLLFPYFEVFIRWKPAVFLLSAIITTMVFLIFAKLIPKIAFRFLSVQVLRNIFLLPHAVFTFIFQPFSGLVQAIAINLSKQNKKTESKNLVFVNMEDWFGDNKEVPAIVKKENLETEVKLFKNALDFSKVKLREIMVPRTEIEMLEIGASMDELRQKFVETGYSRIIFYDRNTDNIVGYVHSSVIFKNPESFRPFIKNVLMVPETMPANKLLSTFIREHRSIAIVVDEFGGTSGLVTSEDILEEIFGEIEDEHDTVDIIEKKISDNEFIFSGRSEIDLLNEKYQINLPETEDFETLAGFILYHHESIPKINSVIKIDNFQFKILKATNTKIELVKLTIEKE